jgi:hypothetical protein
MTQSIKTIGLINPPVLARKSEQPPYRIVSGLKRILALIHLKIDTFPAHIIEETSDGPDVDLFMLNFYENISTRELNPIEKSTVLNELISTYRKTEEVIAKHYLPLMQLGTNPKILDLYLPLIRLEDNLKIAVIEDFFSPELAVTLLRFSHLDRQKMYELFCALRLGKNRQKEFVRLLDDVSHILDKPIAEIVEQPAIQEILNNEKLTVPLRASGIKSLLTKLRYPRLTLSEEKFNQLKKDLKLPPHIILRASPNFEDDKYSLEIIFRNQTEFESALKILEKISHSKRLSQLE